jgi:uncharacterized GH25 family protein
MAQHHRPLIVLAFALMASLPSRAHDFWIEPSSLEPTPNSRVAVRLRVGEQFAGDPVPRNPERIVRFDCVGPNGQTPILGRAGGDPAGTAVVAGSGTYLLAFQSNRATVELDAEKFEQYLALEGLERISALRKERGQSRQPSREVYSRNAKSLLAVGGGADAGFDRVLGLPFELIPEKNPSAIKAGEALPLRLLFRGRPIAGVLVVAVPRSNPKNGAVGARTDAEGRVRLSLPPNDVWLVKAVHMIEAPKDAPNADWESFWTSLTFRGPR